METLVSRVLRPSGQWLVAGRDSEESPGLPRVSQEFLPATKPPTRLVVWKRSVTHFRSVLLGSVVTQLEMADNLPVVYNHIGPEERIKFHLRYECIFYVILFFCTYTQKLWGSSFSSFRGLMVLGVVYHLQKKSGNFGWNVNGKTKLVFPNGKFPGKTGFLER